MKRVFHNHARLVLLIIVGMISILLFASHSFAHGELTHKIIDLSLIIILMVGAWYIGSDLSALYELSRSDSLTGLDNRSRFQDRLSEAILRSQRNQTELFLLVIDVDHFKDINDTCGHSAGDKTLKKLAKVMQRNLRNDDLLARIGGEEFTVILTECDLDESIRVAERLRQQVEKTAFNGYDVTISIGIANLQVGDDHDRLFNRADEALYLAKDIRNSVYVSYDYQIERVPHQS